jgi:UDP-glucose 4-epimerase
MHAIRNNIVPYIEGDGEQRRDMVNVEDVVKANIFCMEQEIDFEGAVLEVGTGTNISLNQIKLIVNKHFPDVDFDYRSPRPGDVKETKAKIAPLKSMGWTANIDIFDGIEDCFRRIKDES